MTEASRSSADASTPTAAELARRLEANLAEAMARRLREVEPITDFRVSAEPGSHES